MLRAPRSFVTVAPVRIATGAVVALAVAVLGGCGERGEPAARRASAEPDRSPPPGAAATAPGDAPVDAMLPAIPGAPLEAFRGRSANIMAMADPASDADAWETEARSAEASAQLKSLASLLGHDAGPDPAALGGIVTSGFHASGLPDADELVEIHRSVSATVHRGHTGVPDDAARPRPLPEFIALLRSPHAGDGTPRIALKNVRVDATDGEPGFVTTALFQSASRTVQQNAGWTCAWTDESPPRLRSILVSDHQQVRSGMRFADVTGTVLGGSASFRQQMTAGARHWADRLQKFHLIDSTGHQGIAVGDADGDGLEDIYLAQQGGLPNRLYLRNADGTLRDAPPESGTDWMELTHGVLFADFDNDGDQDLALAQSDQLLVLANAGGAVFEPAFRLPAEANYYSLAAADFDLDGDLDLFACGYSPRRIDEYAEGARATVPLPYHDSHNGGPNLLLRNEGGLSFSDATAEAGLDAGNDRHSFAAAWEDYDNDGDPDLYVANDFGRNNLYRNDAGALVDVAGDLGVEDMSAGMGVAWADFDRDGWMDVHVSNMFSAAGNRVTYQRQFRPGDDPDSLAGFRRHARGNSLFRNTGGRGPFEDVSVPAGITMGRWAWGAVFADLDNDGWEDLHVANGYITADPKDDL